MHEPPQVPNYFSEALADSEDFDLRPGVVLAIEPMVNIGGWETVVLADDWTAVTKDGSLSAQFEHTLLATRSGVEVLTRRDVLLPHSEDRPYSQLGPLSVPASTMAKD